ncbi:hypothetical protein DL95DRAFT_494855 [Leptodontidium sp. 2 PMI_412]|nr:hypothetical protein DL95DRAFT_494855 [Leptodontidium sp. 2 PMI_412]
MCKLYQIEYTCRHLAKVETAYCRTTQPCTTPSYSLLDILSRPKQNPDQDPTNTATYPANCTRGVEILTQQAPHKCPPCRNYDRDRWRRGWSPIPVSQPARACIPRMRTIPAEPDSDEEDDFAVVFEEGTALGVVEHEEEKGGVGVGLGFGAGVGVGMLMSGGLNGEDTGSSEGFGLGIDGAGAGAGDTSTTTTPTMSSSSISTKKDRGLASKKRAESFAAGDGETVGDELRSRFGGFGGKKLRGRRSSTVEAMGGVPMERTASRRGSLSLRSPGGSSYRGADMERGGGAGLGLGIGFGVGDMSAGGVIKDQKESQGGDLGLGIGLGFGGVAMEKEGGKTAIQISEVQDSLSTRRRSHNISKISPVSTSEVDGTSDDIESVTAQFLDF